MINVVIDTCVWIELAEKPPLHPLLTELCKLSSTATHQLTLPSPIPIEFERNRVRAMEKWAKSFDSHRSQLAIVTPHLADVEKHIEAIVQACKKAAADARKVMPSGFAEIDRAFRGARPWRPNAAHYEEACRRCLEIVAPALNDQRSSIGDCLIWLGVLDCLDDGDVWFCTANKKDFSDPQRFDQAHPYLLDEAGKKRGNFRYFNDPNSLVEVLRQAAPAPKEEVVPPMPRYYDYAPSPPDRCQACGIKSMMPSAYLRSRYGGLTLQFICPNCGTHHDTGDSFD